jgi:ribosomal protein S18 acetylase RimI-like enzyme
MTLEKIQVTRPITEQDRTELASLIHFSTYVHRHLDWRTPMDWIGHPPYYALESSDRLIASLACSPDIPEIAWVRVFVCATTIAPRDAWKILWPPVIEELESQGIHKLAAIPIQKWFRELLESAGFSRLHHIVTLAWDNTTLPEETADQSSFTLREMLPTDLKSVENIDGRAFEPLWQHSYDLIELAYSQAAYADVATIGGQVVGYQISTSTQYGAHLGRLAVDPDAQHRGIGFGLLRHLQRQLGHTGPARLSVNTHDTNQSSLGLYLKAGFRKTEEIFPVYQYNI